MMIIHLKYKKSKIIRNFILRPSYLKSFLEIEGLSGQKGRELSRKSSININILEPD